MSAHAKEEAASRPKAVGGGWLAGVPGRQVLVDSGAPVSWREHQAERDPTRAHASASPYPQVCGNFPCVGVEDGEMAKRERAQSARIAMFVIAAATLLAAVDAIASPPPRLMWKRESSLCMVSRPALGDDGTFYASALPSAACDLSSSYGMTAFRSIDGSDLWGPVLAPGCSQFGPLGGRGVSVDSSGKLFVLNDANSCGNGALVAMDGATGAIAWTHAGCAGSPHPRHTPAIDESLNSVYFGSASLCSVDSATGADKWSTGGGYYIGARGIGIDTSGNIFNGSYDGQGQYTKFRSLTSDGVVRWDRTFTANAPAIQAIQDDGSILLWDNVAFTMESWESDGSGRWANGNFRYPVTDESGNVYATGAGVPDVISFDASGNQRWLTTLPCSDRATTDFIDNAGNLYVHNGDTLFALDSGDGSVLWAFRMDTGFNAGHSDNPSVVLAPGGRIFLSDSAGGFYLLDTAVEYAASSWPLAESADRRNTGHAGRNLPTPAPAAGCGNGILDGAEECDTPSDSACPGRCAYPGQAGACTCLAEPHAPSAVFACTDACGDGVVTT
ncbi:MAG: PQQ-like domain, partial [candidate division NC10 bacterium]|nr:PQQ-like domain [candidate division NC10 bacterium]